MPLPEVILWQKLRAKQLNGVKFRRQYSIGKYIVDFYAPKHKVVIEIDGDTHERQADLPRESYIRSLGMKVIRYTNQQITKQLPDVLEDIIKHLQ